MNHEIQLKTLTSFVNYRAYVLSALKSDKAAQTQNSVDQAKYLSCLLHMPVSKRSAFSDMEWDFNGDYPNAARSIRGAKQRIDFSKYHAVPPFALAEIKILFHLVHLNPLIFQPERKDTRKRGKSKLKVNTIIDVFESGLRYINTVFEFANDLYGKEHIQDTISSITDICADDYREAAKRHDYVCDNVINRFFDYLRHPYTVKNILGGVSLGVDLDTLEWKKVSRARVNPKDQILPNDFFERLSAKSSALIADFLQIMGESVCDQRSLKYLNGKKESLSQTAGLTVENFNAYRVLRLRQKGYSEAFINRYPIPSWLFSVSENGLRELRPYSQVDYLSRGIYKRNPLRLHLNAVYYACVYIVGQYTGMRNSEMSEVLVQDSQCLIEEGKHWVLKSTVKKHKEDLCGLFDDKWVAIPVVRDAIKAAALIGTIKNNPYLVSNMDTVAPAEQPNSMVTIKHQMDTFFADILGKEQATKISFNQYMLRHTLAYQLFRADLGLPFISYQLKHFVSGVESYTSRGATSDVTLGYGEIGELLSQGGRGKNRYRHQAEVESVLSVMDPDGVYIGSKAKEHKARLKKLFRGYVAAGYTKEEVVEQMAQQGLAVVNVGQGYCYGGEAEDFDESLPCIGGLRCNPVRCSNAFVGKQHAPKWREVYLQNKANLDNPEYSHNIDQIKEAINEAKMVLEYLGEDLEV